jgi:hypothetical protein
MPSDNVGNWTQNVKNPAAKAGKQAPKSKGNLIMEIAERILPWVRENLTGKRDPDGMLIQPAVMRAIAINTAQLYLDTEEKA